MAVSYTHLDVYKRQVLGEVVDLFTNEVKMDGTEASKDLLGRTYEYCICLLYTSTGRQYVYRIYTANDFQYDQR